jgi:hypothetical protein
VTFGIVDDVGAGLADPEADLGYARAGGLRRSRWAGTSAIVMHCTWVTSPVRGVPRKPVPGDPSMMTPPLSRSSSPSLTVPSPRLSRTRSVKAKVLISQSMAAPASAYKR